MAMVPQGAQKVEDHLQNHPLVHHSMVLGNLPDHLLDLHDL